MNKRWLLGILLIALALVLAAWNLVSGWLLTQSDLTQAEGHLTRGISTSILCIVGNLLCVLASSEEAHDLRTRLVDRIDAVSAYEPFKELQKSASLWAWSCIGIVIPGVITGTSSQAGNLPFVHAVLGLGVVIAYTGAIVFWFRLLKLSQRLKLAF